MVLCPVLWSSFLRTVEILVLLTVTCPRSLSYHGRKEGRKEGRKYMPEKEYVWSGKIQGQERIRKWKKGRFELKLYYHEPIFSVS